MFRWRNNQPNQEKAAEYATRHDFQQIFTEDMAGLHLLAFLLTADQHKAEECFVTGLEDTVRANPIFRTWARTWSKRAIIKNAIKMVAPAPGQSAPVATAGATSSDLANDRLSESDGRRHTTEQGRALIVSVTQLAPFDRFVLVMTVLEGYSIHECAVLLGRSAQEVAAAKSQALQCLGSPQPSQAPGSSKRVSSLSSFLSPSE